MKSKTLILPEVSSLLMIQIFDNTVNDCGGLAENVYFLALCLLPFLNFLCHLKYGVKQNVKEHEKFHVMYYLIFVKNKSEFFLCYTLSLI